MVASGERGQGWDAACARSLEDGWSLHRGQRTVPPGAEPTNSKTGGKGGCRRAGTVLPAAEGGQEPGTGERLDRRVQRVCHWDLYKGQCQWVGAETALRETKEKLRQMKTLPKDPATKGERHR